jgi:hypothetical protein
MTGKTLAGRVMTIYFDGRAYIFEFDEKEMGGFRRSLQATDLSSRPEVGPTVDADDLFYAVLKNTREDDPQRKELASAIKGSVTEVLRKAGIQVRLT